MATQRKQTTNTRCSVCRHPDRHAIEMAHVAGCSLEAIAVKYSKPEHALHRASVHRHCRDHLDEAARASYLADVPIQELTARAAKEGVTLLDYLGLIRSTLISQMLVASGVNDGHRVAALAGRSIEVLREIGRLTGELSKIGSAISITNNVAIFNDPKFIELQAGLLAIARAHPDARADIVALLCTLDSRPVLSRPNGAQPQMIEGEVHHES